MGSFDWFVSDLNTGAASAAPLGEADSRDFDALLLPGGVANPDQLRIIPEAIDFVREFFAAEKPVASICHGPWPLIEAGVVRGRTMTSWPSLKTDLDQCRCQVGRSGGGHRQRTGDEP